MSTISNKLRDGDHPMMAEFERSGVGLKFNIRAHPVIEEFMRNAMGVSEPSMRPVEEFSRHWEPAKGESRKELLVYDIPKELTGVFPISSGASYRMDRPGYPIFVPGDGLETRGAPRVLNLSFLRLVGISEPGGVTFHIGGIYSEPLLDELESVLHNATREVYNQFMKPIKISVELVVRNPGEERSLVVDVPLPPNTDETTVEGVQ